VAKTQRCSKIGGWSISEEDHCWRILEPDDWKASRRVKDPRTHRGNAVVVIVIVPADDSDDSPRQPSSSIASRFPEDSDRRTLPSLKAVGLLDSFESRRTNTEPRSVLPPLSKAREW
jgi:hypothetical protein